MYKTYKFMSLDRSIRPYLTDQVDSIELGSWALGESLGLHFQCGRRREVGLVTSSIEPLRSYENSTGRFELIM